jgi:hypothetical protein
MMINTNNTYTSLLKHCEFVAKEFEKVGKKPYHDNSETYYENIYDWLDDQLDIEYTISSRGEYISGCVITSTGGPHIEIDTGLGRVIGYWGVDKAETFISRDAINQLDDALKEMHKNLSRN